MWNNRWLLFLEAVTLTIEPGVVVKFFDPSIMVVHGHPCGIRHDQSADLLYLFFCDGGGGATKGDGSASSPASGDWDYLSFTSEQRLKFQSLLEGKT